MVLCETATPSRQNHLRGELPCQSPLSSQVTSRSCHQRIPPGRCSNICYILSCHQGPRTYGTGRVSGMLCPVCACTWQIKTARKICICANIISPHNGSHCELHTVLALYAEQLWFYSYPQGTHNLVGCVMNTHRINDLASRLGLLSLPSVFTDTVSFDPYNRSWKQHGVTIAKQIPNLGLQSEFVMN